MMKVVITAFCALSLGALGCNSVPVESLEKSFTLKVKQSSGTSEKVKIDFLWVVDNSTSMCEEQVSLTDNFSIFTSSLTTAFQIAPRVAVTTADAQCEPREPSQTSGAVTSQGTFNKYPASGFPPSCYSKKPVPCLSDSDCANNLGEGDWKCKAASSAQCLENPNGSVNSYCWRGCQESQDCIDFYGNPNYVCQKPSGNQDEWGCLLPPSTDGCPTELPEYLTDLPLSCDDGETCAIPSFIDDCTLEATGLVCGASCQSTSDCGEGEVCWDVGGQVKICEPEDADAACEAGAEECGKTCSTSLDCAEGLRCRNKGSRQCVPQPKTCADGTTCAGTMLDFFNCVATVGVNQTKCFKYEQGLRSAMDALDVGGRQAEQAKRFLRDDAYLVIIFVSDEDDCSVAEGWELSESNYDTCNLLPDTDDPSVDTSAKRDALVPVSSYINRFKALKGDPSRVIVAAIAGDSEADTAEGVEADRADYLTSKGDKKVCFQQTKICASDVAQADWGSRYLQLTEGFGPNGIFSNICEEEGIGPALQDIADTIIRVVKKVCLPKPVFEGTEVLVTKTVDGVTKTLQEGTGEEDYQIVPGGDDCQIGDQQMPAIVFTNPPQPGEEIDITYRGDPGFE